MVTLGIESSCDEFAVAVLKDKTILSSVIASQIEEHRQFGGVAPELASRLHTELAMPSILNALKKANISPCDIDNVAYTNRPGLVGSLLVGSSVAKAMAWALDVPFIAVDHIQAHLYINHLVSEIAFPYLGVVVSGGHTTILVVHSFNHFDVIGSTIDDALGESYDKIAKHYQWGYPGGPIIDEMAKLGDELAYKFPFANLYKGDHRYDLSYSGLKNAVANQKEQFHVAGHGNTDYDLAASFQLAAISILVAKIKKALTDFKLKTITIGGGVAANSYLEKKIKALKGITSYIPPHHLCGDNGEMIAFLGQQLIKFGHKSSLTDGVSSRVLQFKRGLSPLKR